MTYPLARGYYNQMKKTHKITGVARKELLLNAALALSETVGYQNITRESIANLANVSPGLISQYFGTMVQLKRSVMRAAIAREIITVVAQGLGVRDPQALKAPEALKQKAIEHLIK